MHAVVLRGTGSPIIQVLHPLRCSSAFILAFRIDPSKESLRSKVDANAAKQQNRTQRNDKAQAEAEEEAPVEDKVQLWEVLCQEIGRWQKEEAVEAMKGKEDEPPQMKEAEEDEQNEAKEDHGTGAEILQFLFLCQ
ncbi:hypothetical protein QOT17_024919, partial [Balamuthia mandrillaris]